MGGILDKALEALMPKRVTIDLDERTLNASSLALMGFLAQRAIVIDRATAKLAIIDVIRSIGTPGVK